MGLFSRQPKVAKEIYGGASAHLVTDYNILKEV